MNLKALRAFGMTTVAAAAFCASASAYTLAFPAGTPGPVGGIDTLSDTRFASEIAAATPVPALAIVPGLRVNLVPDADGSLPSGNTILKVTLNNGTFRSAITSANILIGSCGGSFSGTVSSGGGVGSSSVTFVLSDANNCTLANPVLFSLPVDVTTNGSTATLTTEYKTDGGSNPIEGGTEAGGPFIWAQFAPAFTFTSASPQDDRTTTINPSPVYSTFGGPGFFTAQLSNSVVGTVVATNLLADLTAPAATNLATAALVVNGSTVGYDTNGGLDISPAYGAVGDLDVVGNTFTTPFAETDGEAIFNGGPRIFSVDSNELGGIAASSYTASLSVTFENTFGLAPKAFTLASNQLSRVVRDGWSGMATWLTDERITNVEVIRIVATTATSGPLRAQMMTRALGGGSVPGPTVILAPQLAAGEEFIINKQLLLANFGNSYTGTAKAADLFLTVEGSNSSIIAQRLVAVQGYGMTWIPIINCTGNSSSGTDSADSNVEPAHC